MAEIVVRVNGTDRRFGPDDQPISIGRAAGSTVVADAAAVSSTHATLTFEGGQWVYRDQSTNGSYVNNTKTTAFSIAEPVTVVLGNLDQGLAIDVAPAGMLPPAPPTYAPPPTAAPPGVPTIGGPGLAASGGGQQMSSIHSPTMLAPQELRGGPPPTAPPGAMPGQDVKIQYAGGEFVAHPGQTVTFGRDPSNDITLDNPTVSRRHAQLSYTPQGWQLVDVGSSRALTVDGDAVRQVTLRGATDVWFGPEEAGVRVIFAAPGKAKKKGGLSPLVVVVPVAAVLLVAIVAVVAVARSSNQTAGTTPTTGAPSFDLTALKKGTVRIDVFFQLDSSMDRKWEQIKREQDLPDDAGQASGSGTIISADGLVLTNAHVVTPSEVPGAETDLTVDSIKVAINRDGSDAPLVSSNDAEVVVSVPELDLAIIKIKGVSNLPAIPLANDKTLNAGEDVVILGFPAVSRSRGVNVTSGKVSSFLPDKSIDADRAWINTDAKIDPGNSGGLAANKENKIVGVPTNVCFEPFGSSSSGSGGPLSQQNRVRVIDLARPMVEAATTGRDYDRVSAERVPCNKG